MLAKAKKRKEGLTRKNQEKMMKRYVSQMTSRWKAANNRVDAELSALKKAIGAEDFRMLSDICTVNTPEQKDLDGKVTQEAKSELNKGALLREAKNLLILKREERIKRGLRKRTTGRAGRRAAHASAVKYLLKRNEEAKAEDLP